MQNPDSSPDWIAQAIRHWQNEGIPLQEGATRDDIRRVEEALGYTFPQDFIELYQRVNGFANMHWNENMFLLWPLERILEEHNYKRDVDLIGFADFMIVTYEIGFSRSDGQIYKGYDKETPVTESFTAFISLLNSNDELIY